MHQLQQWFQVIAVGKYLSANDRRWRLDLLPSINENKAITGSDMSNPRVSG